MIHTAFRNVDLLRLWRPKENLSSLPPPLVIRDTAGYPPQYSIDGTAGSYPGYLSRREARIICNTYAEHDKSDITRRLSPSVKLFLFFFFHFLIRCTACTLLGEILGSVSERIYSNDRIEFCFSFARARALLLLRGESHAANKIEFDREVP